MTRSRTVNVRDLRRDNRSRLLSTLYLHGPMTRQEVGEANQVSPATVSNLVAELLAEGVLVEAGSLDSPGGRPRVLLQVDPGYAYVIGVDVGETAVLVELFDLSLQALASYRATPTSSVLDAEESAGQVLSGIAHVVARAAVVEDHILGVGVGVPGLVQRGKDDDQALVYAQTVGWDGVPFGRLLRRGTSLPLLVDNGAKTFGQAEAWFGAARECDDTIVVLLGTGVGTSIISHGRLHRGWSSSAGEWGHTTVVVDGRQCRCGARGCLEAYVGAGAVLERYAQLGGPPSSRDGPGPRRRAASGDGVGDGVEERLAALLAARPEDAAAAQVLAETANHLGAGIADLINLFNPQRVVVGGWAGRLLGDRLLPEIIAAAARHALRLPFSEASIVPAEFGEDAVALGAATLPVAAFLTRGGTRPAPVPERPRRPGVRARQPAG